MSLKCDVIRKFKITLMCTFMAILIAALILEETLDKNSDLRPWLIWMSAGGLVGVFATSVGIATCS